MATQCRVQTATIRGIEAVPVDAEVEVGAGLPSFAIVGLPDLAVQEARERVRSALRASGFEVPNARIVVNLAPGPLRKHGTGFDLPIALGILGATGQLPRSVVEACLAVGELSLDGSVRSIPGLLAHALAAQANGLALLTTRDADDVASFSEVDLRPIGRLSELRQGLPEPADRRGDVLGIPCHDMDFADVKGQALAKRALLIAAAGSHNLLMVGPPGAGKSMLARCLPSILPPLDQTERVETALVHSVAGLQDRNAFVGERPFRAPHHAASIAGLIGGGSPPRPGEISLAHNGVLFLDEMPEFGPASLQALRQPMEDGQVALVRADGRLSYPARFALIAAANPCPCGYFGDPVKHCKCSTAIIQRYRNRIGGPLLDRIDLRVDVERVDPGLILRDDAMATSAEMRSIVLRARESAAARDDRQTSRLSGTALLRACRMEAPAVAQLEQAARHHNLSGRSVTRLLRVARTIADLEDSPRVDRMHVVEAVGFRVEEARWD